MVTAAKCPHCGAACWSNTYLCGVCGKQTGFAADPNAPTPQPSASAAPQAQPQIQIVPVPSIIPTMSDKWMRWIYKTFRTMAYLTWIAGGILLVVLIITGVKILFERGDGITGEVKIQAMMINWVFMMQTAGACWVGGLMWLFMSEITAWFRHTAPRVNP